MEPSKVSIIVPVYNTEKYVGRCAAGILNQTYENLEVILVDDGSTDKSGRICDEYREKDSRIKVIHQANHGVSHARNQGVLAAAGDFIEFVDSDDYIDPDMTSDFVRNMSGSTELIICGYKSICVPADRPTVIENIPPVTGSYTKSDFLKHFGELYSAHFINSPCNKLYLADIIRQHNIKFPEDLTMGEDLLFNLAYIDRIDGIRILGSSPYNYINFNNNSLTASFKKDSFKNQKKLFQKVREFLLGNSRYTEENRKRIEAVYMDTVIDCLSNLFSTRNNLTKEEQNKSVGEIVEDDFVRRNLYLYRRGKMQKRVVGFLIRMKLIRAIKCCFMLKNYTQKTQLFFTILHIR